MIEITYEEVKKFLVETEFCHIPGQKEVSFPVIQRIHRRLQQGHSFRSIRAREGRIIDGHHRYICHKLLNLNLDLVIGGANSSDEDYIWTEINLTHDDYDSEAKRKNYEKLYDKQ